MKDGLAVEQPLAGTSASHGVEAVVRVVRPVDSWRKESAPQGDTGARQDAANTAPPLYVDLDNTLIRSDSLIEGVLALLRNNFACLFLLPFWLLRGKAFLKHQVAIRVELHAPLLPYHSEFLEYLRGEARLGRQLVLATAANRRVARAVAEHLGLFAGVIASEESVNCSGVRKLEAIRRHCGGGEFAYAGDSPDDVPIFRSASSCVLVNAGAGVEREARRGGARIERVFRAGGRPLAGLLKAMRCHQWVKNLLLFVPMVVSHKWSGATFVELGLGVAAFSFCASGVYLFNDLFDLQADRAHARKRSRALASGELPLLYGGLMAVLLPVAGLIIAGQVSATFLGILFAYLAFTAAYTVYLKEVALVDVITLAGLYTLRIVAGAAAIEVVPSFWLLAFSMFAFLSLALIKRCAELHRVRGTDVAAPGRGYVGADYDLLQGIGVASAYVAVLVIALYINSPDVTSLYSRPVVLWLLCPAVLYWFSRLWMKTGRREMHDDPVVFSFRDRGSRAVAMFSGLVMLLAI